MTKKWVTGYLPPTLSVSDTTMKVDMKWINNWSSIKYDGKYDMDTWVCLKNEAGGHLRETEHVGLGLVESDTYEYARSLFHPLGSRKVKHIDTWVRWVGYSQKKDSKGKPIANSYYVSARGAWLKGPRLTLRAPLPPKLTLDVSKASDGSVKEITVKVDLPDSDYRTDVYDVVLVGTKRSPKTYPKDFVGPKQSSTTVTILNRNLLSGAASRRTVRKSGFEQSFDVSTIENGLKNGQWVDITFKAYARGITGNSSTTTSTHIFAAPATPQISKVSTTGTRTTGYTIVSLKTNSSKYRPVDKVTLQRLYNSEATTANQAASMTGWQDVASDDGDCVALRDANASCWPPEGEDGRGNRTWYRLKSQHDGLVAYSAPVAHPKHFPYVKVTEPNAKIMAVETFNAESVYVDLVWPDPTFSDKNMSAAEKAKYSFETEVAWSTYSHAWNATKRPESYAFSWKDATNRYPNVKINGVKCTNEARIYINDLTPGEPVYVRVRRNYTYNGATTQGKWSELHSGIPQKPPAWVKADAPDAILRGKSIPVSWEFEGDFKQKEWRIENEDGVVWAHGTGTRKSYNIPYNANSSSIGYGSKTAKLKAMSVRVLVLAGGDWKASSTIPIVIDDKPACSLTCNAAFSSMPFQFKVGAGGQSGRIIVKSRGIVYLRPDGSHRQAAGEIVAAYNQAKVVTVSSGSFIDGCVYDIEAQSVMEATGTASDKAKCSFRINWAHKAKAPIATVTPDKENLSAQIKVMAPSGALSTDVYDVYRVTPDRVYLIASSLKSGTTIIDYYAPFASRGMDVKPTYRVATRTKEGHEAWEDFEYDLDFDGIRLDWNGRHVHLPYNIGISGDISKDFDARSHFGDKLPDGYWNEGITRRASLSTDLIKLESAEERRMVADMANFSGPVFVRLGNGSAYEANVELTNMGESYDSGVLAVSLDAIEVELTDDYKASKV